MLFLKIVRLLTQAADQYLQGAYLVFSLKSTTRALLAMLKIGLRSKWRDLQDAVVVFWSQCQWEWQHGDWTVDLPYKWDAVAVSNAVLLSSVGVTTLTLLYCEYTVPEGSFSTEMFNFNVCNTVFSGLIVRACPTGSCTAGVAGGQKRRITRGHSVASTDGVLT